MRHLALLVFFVLPKQLVAQTPSADNAWPQRAWAFAGLGRGSIQSRAIAGTVGGSYAPGPLVFTIRRSGAGQFPFGDAIGETALLIGVRSPGKRAFLSAQVGVSAIHRSHTCDCSGGDWTGPTQSATAFDISAQANQIVAGIGLDVFGTLGSPGRRYAAMAVIIQLGWFGE